MEQYSALCCHSYLRVYTYFALRPDHRTALQRRNTSDRYGRILFLEIWLKCRGFGCSVWATSRVGEEGGGESAAVFICDQPIRKFLCEK